MQAYEHALYRADSLMQCGAADSAQAVRLLSGLRREYDALKQELGTRRVRLTPQDPRKRLFWQLFSVVMLSLNVWLSLSNFKLFSDRKHRRYLVDLSENEQRLHDNEQERAELEECLREMSLTDEERDELHQSLTNLLAYGQRLHEENESLRLRLKEYENRPLPREVELLKEQEERVRRLGEQVQALTSLLLEQDELVEQLRQQPRYLTDAQWEHLHRLADRVYGDFSRRLSLRFPRLTPSDLQLCLLIRLRFTNAQIAVFMAVSPASVSQQKFRLKKRLLQTDETLFAEGDTLERVLCSV